MDAITQRYLHVKPHPELAWWAVRVQLVDKPGYMVNYGLGAVITADIRQRIRSSSVRLSRRSALVRLAVAAAARQRRGARNLYCCVQFLGRAVSEQALLRDFSALARSLRAVGGGAG